MKRYQAQAMIQKSRHALYFPLLERDVRQDVIARVEQLIREENAFCDRGNYGHLCNIFTAIALYEALQAHGRSEEEAFAAVSGEMYKFLQPGRRRFQRLSAKGWFWPVMKIIIPLGFRLGSGTGWRYTWFKGQPKNEFRFETNACIYQKIFKKRGLEKLGPMFCHCDIINYGELDGIDFQRRGTLCYGDETCDFKFVHYPRGETFDRTASR